MRGFTVSSENKDVLLQVWKALAVLLSVPGDDLRAGMILKPGHDGIEISRFSVVGSDADDVYRVQSAVRTLLTRLEMNVSGVESFDVKAVEMICPTVLLSGMPSTEKQRAFLRMTLEDMQDRISARLYNALKNDKLLDGASIVEHSEDEMMRVPNIARKSVNELKDFLAEYDMWLGIELTGWPSAET